MKYSVILHRIIKIMSGKKGIYCKYGKGNRFSEGVLAYENAIIGNYNYFAPYSLINNARIGNYCSVGPGCKIGLGEHDINAISLRPIISNGKGDMSIFDLEHPTIIGNDVWIGSNVIIKQGVTIGNGAVIGANSLVLKDIQGYSVSFGSPAKKARMRFSDPVINKIEESKWFDHSPEAAKKIVALLNGEINEDNANNCCR